jgi:hypothetical protein
VLNRPIRLFLMTPVLVAGMSSNPAVATEVVTATYLGGAEAREEWTAVDIAPDGTVVVAGTAPDVVVKDVKPVELIGGGYGVVLRLNAEGNQVLSLTHLGDYIEDMEVGEDGRIAVTGSFGVAVLSPDATQVLWRDGAIIRGTKAAQFRNQTPPFRQERYTRRVARIAIGGDGTVASFQMDEKVHGGSDPKKGHLYIWDKDGRQICDVQMTKYKYPEDLCVSAKHGLVIVGGFNTYAADSKHMKSHPIHMPFLTAYDYTGKVKWAAYDFTAADTYAQNTFADSRVQRLAIGRDGFLYMGGYIHGGDYVWHHDPFDVTKKQNAHVGYDPFSVAMNMGKGIDQAYFAKYDPATGQILLSQALLCRQNQDGKGKPTQIQIRGIHADVDGMVYLSGYCEAFIKDRDQQKVAGVPVGPYAKPEPFLMVVSPDFKKRELWTVFAKKDCEAAAWGVSVRNGNAALIGEVYEGEVITTENAPAKAPAKHVDGYLVVTRPKATAQP